MRKVSLFAGVALAAVAAVTWVGQALSQEGEGGRREGRREGRRRGFDPERMREFRERAMQRMKERLEIGDEEWQVIRPRMEKVNQLRGQLRGGGRRGGFGMFGPGGPRRRGQRPGGAGGEGGEAAPDATPVQKAMGDLRQALENKETPAEDLKTKLAALRQAREEVRKQVTKAQDELRELLTQRQEAFLVLMGQLD